MLDSNELNKVILREFHEKTYSSHLVYQKKLTGVKIYYYWPNLKKDVEMFMARCSDC